MEDAPRMIDVSRLGRGFANMVLASQAAFHALMWAMSRPGRVQRLNAEIDPPEGLGLAVSVALLTLADFETPVYLPTARSGGSAGDYLRFHAGCPMTADPAVAQFAAVDATEATEVLRRLPVGEDRYPDRSATLFVEVPSLAGGLAVRLAGPGVESHVDIAPRGLNAEFWAAMAGNHAHYPLGVDVYLAAGDAVIGLPRSVSAVVVEG